MVPTVFADRLLSLEEVALIGCDENAMQRQKIHDVIGKLGDLLDRILLLVDFNPDDAIPNREESSRRMTAGPSLSDCGKLLNSIISLDLPN